MGPVFPFLGVSLGMITHDASFVFEPGYPTTDERLINLRPVSRREAYAADVTYGTNNEFGFDYLRDNMVVELDQRVQRERSFAIVDEVDNILIDEARTPLIISGQAEESGDLYYTFARLVPKLKGRAEGAEEGGDFFVDLKDRAVSPTEEGVDKMEGLLGVANLYDADPRLARHFEQALRAHALYKRDKDYIVKDGEIVIVDEFTGRQMPGRRWSEGLHQAIEAKEGLRVQRESVTLATITFQNYFRLYDKLAGMTGTAMTEAEEFHKIYNLEVVAIPTHKEMIREDDADLVFRNEGSKFNALIDEIVEMQETGRPVLVGTITVEKSEVLSTLLKRRGIKHETLNAKFHEKESGIVAQAGRTGAVTIATNMAGRGTDIKLGGNPAGLASEILHKRGLNPAEVDKATYEAALAEAKAITDEDHERVVEAGGLHIIGTERHDSRRIDNQLRGRAGRQGDPGSSRFYLSLEDDLMKRFASDRVAGLMERLGLEDDVAIESRLVSKTIESAQSRVEGFNFDMRKRVVEFDDVINRQRETIYAERDKVLRNEDLTETVQTFVEDEIHTLVDTHLSGENVDDWGMEALAAALRAMGIDGPGTTEDELWELGNREAVIEHLLDLADAKLEAKENEVGETDWATVERLVLLRTIDSLWVEHLTEIDDMRRGIGLRGYAQQDPLNEFRREAFRLYEELRGLIRHQVATTIFRVTVSRQTSPTAGRRRQWPGERQPGRRGRPRRPGRHRRPACGTAASGGGSPRPADRRRPRPGSDGPGVPPGSGRRTAAAPGEAKPGIHPERGADRPQRPVLVRLRPEVQEVPRPLTGRRARRPAARAHPPGIVAKHLIRLALAAVGGAIVVSAYTAFRIWDQGSATRPTGRRDRRPRRGPVRRRAVAAVRGPPRPRGRALHDGVAPILVVTGGKGRAGDVTTEAEAARDLRRRPRRPGRGDPRRGPRPEHARVAAERRRDAPRSGPPLGRLRLRPDPHAPRPADGPRPGHRAYGSPTTTSPIESNVVEQVKDTVHEIGGLAVYFLAGAGI